MIRISIPPTIEPVTLSEMKMWLKIEEEETVEDALLTSLIKAQRQWVEEHCGIAIMTQTIIETYDRWSRKFYLHRAPVAEVIEIIYIDNDEEKVYQKNLQISPQPQPQFVQKYVEDLYSIPARILVTGETPPVDTTLAAVSITYTAGYGDITLVPEYFKLAIMYKVAASYTKRSDYAERYLNHSLSLLRTHKSQYTPII